MLLRTLFLSRSLPFSAGVILACLSWLPVSSAMASVGFEAVLSFPHATDLVASPVGDRISWVSQQEGARNVWVADGPDWEGRPLTHYEGDTGDAITDLRFTPDGESVMFLRGGARNREGDLPNPTSRPEGVARKLWVVPAHGEAVPRELAETDDFDVSPDGESVFFLKDSQVWMRGLSRAEEGGSLETVKNDGPGDKPLFSVRRGVSTFSIAPDGSRIAFVSDRGDHAFIGVYDREENAITWLEPSLDRDRAPTWSPDGEHIAFLRIPNEKRILPFVPRREGLPWSIRIGNASTGDTREIFRADAGPGSPFQPGYWFVGDRLWWGADDRILFPWEKTGWLHIWSVASAGGEAVDLTPGEGEVQYADLAPDRSALLYSANHGDLHRRHLWQTPVAGGEPERLTTGSGIEWMPGRTGSGTLVFLASAAREPAHPVVLVEGARRAPGPPLPERFPTQGLVQPELVSFPAADGLQIHAQVFLPPAQCGRGPHPGLLFFHGGSRRQMLMGFHPGSYYSNAYAFNQAMAARCFVVAAVNYRSGVGYGMEFREARDYGARGASEYRDVVGAGIYLAGRDDVDPARLGLWGGSYGGYLTALGLARASDLFAAGVDLHGVHDWNVVIGNFASAYDPGMDEDFADLAWQSSPMADVGTWTSPVLLIHGDDDRNVPFSESVDLAEALRRQGTPVESLVFPDEVHGFLLHRNWLAAYRAAAAFLDRKLAVAD
ncbi:S9 family peptidase [Chromatocurvus halotolerans]|uniref:Acyl-peptide hydrolase n=1 Tax=Chromatocurvus halotolerans TaxID=1132028 RepID=A0A4R2KRV1_9GAMM|nr:prolyl oligopeptidase family serine peptidase [Chromatocurvus halotolerans]TCO75507.1 dipeptidyl aminopeptidase/acylaminoacyl peptidase [Chromatocurvus halotolerans]